jgi:regulator of RNase E activity RraA
MPNTKPWTSDEELFNLARRELFTAVVGDVMDKMRLRNQFLPPEIKPLREDMVVIGRAMTVLSVDVFEEVMEDTANPIMAKPFGLMLEALDQLRPHEIYVNTGSSPRNALWGELMTVRALKLKSAGAIVNGYMRDARAVLAMNFPTFCFGRYAQDSAPRYKVMDYRVPIEVGRARIQPGDILFGDIDGVCAIPREAEEEVFRRALEKARGEKLVRKAIDDGMSAVQAFETYGIM